MQLRRDEAEPRVTTVIWVGGTSALARTYFDEVHPTVRDRLHIVVAAPALPSWTLPKVGVSFVALDLLDVKSVDSFFSRPELLDTYRTGPSVMIIGVRLSLVWAGSRQSTLAAHLGRLISRAAVAGCLGVVHISSVAVADHVVSQHNVSESAPLPALDAYHSDYDRFKRLSEVIVDDECTKANERAALSGETRMMVWTHLRISGIFSNDPACIQCTAVRNQAYISAYSSTCIDFNSSANVSHAITLLVERIVRVVTAQSASADPSVPVECAANPDGHRVQRVYYYTRATTEPVPYGALVADYRSAHGIQYGVWLPEILYLGFVRFVQALCALCRWLALARSVAYLLAVSVADHTFDCSRFREDFPEMQAREESIRECFVRIRQRQEEALALSRADALSRSDTAKLG